MVTTIIIMESSKQQSFPFDMGLGLYHEHTTATFLDPPPSTNDDTSFELDFLSSSPIDDITSQQQDLLAPSLTSCFPFDQQQQQHSPLQDNEQPYCSPSFLFTHLDINQTDQQQQQQQRPMESHKEEEEEEEGTIECYNCKVISTPLWRRTPDRAHILCNACGLYYKQYKRHRPVRIWQRATRWLGIEGYYQNQIQYQQHQYTTTTPPMQQQQCANCHQTDTPLWRKNSRGQSICNACGLFFKLHHRDRPMELNKTNSQRRRRRRREPLTGTEEMFMGLRADMSRDEMQLVLRIMEERCAFLKAMLGNNNVSCNSSSSSSSNNDDPQLPPPPQQQQQQEIFGYM